MMKMAVFAKELKTIEEQMIFRSPGDDLLLLFFFFFFFFLGRCVWARCMNQNGVSVKDKKK
jgi:hypothetical protein